MMLTNLLLLFDGHLLLVILTVKVVFTELFLLFVLAQMLTSRLIRSDNGRFSSRFGAFICYLFLLLLFVFVA